MFSISGEAPAAAMACAAGRPMLGIVVFDAVEEATFSRLLLASIFLGKTKAAEAYKMTFQWLRHLRMEKGSKRTGQEAVCWPKRPEERTWPLEVHSRPWVHMGHILHKARNRHMGRKGQVVGTWACRRARNHPTPCPSSA